MKTSTLCRMQQGDVARTALVWQPSNPRRPSALASMDKDDIQKDRTRANTALARIIGSACLLAKASTCVCACVRACVRVRVRVCKRARARACLNACVSGVRTCVSACVCVWCVCVVTLLCARARAWHRPAPWEPHHGRYGVKPSAATFL